MNMIPKGQVRGVNKGDVPASIEFVSQIFGVAQSETGIEQDCLSLKYFCDTTPTLSLPTPYETETD